MKCCNQSHTVTFKMRLTVLNTENAMVNVSSMNSGLPADTPDSTLCPQKNGPPKYNGVIFKILGKHQ